MPLFDDVVLWGSYAVILPAWAALMLAPGWRPTQLLARSLAVSLLLAGLYLVLVLLRDNHDPNAGVWTMEQLTALFADRRVVLIGWIHYLSFDLLVGCWMAGHAARDGVSRWLVAPCLVFVLLMGPIGLLMYAALRWALRRGWDAGFTSSASAR